MKTSIIPSCLPDIITAGNSDYPIILYMSWTLAKQVELKLAGIQLSYRLFVDEANTGPSFLSGLIFNCKAAECIPVFFNT